MNYQTKHAGLSLASLSDAFGHTPLALYGNREPSGRPQATRGSIGELAAATCNQRRAVP